MPERPLVWSTAAFGAGLFLCSPELGAGCWAACALTLLAGACCLAAVARCPRALRASTCALIAGFFAAGRVAQIGGAHAEPDAIATLVHRHPDLFDSGVDLEGTIAREPAILPAGASGRAEIELLIDLQRARLLRLWAPARGRVRVRVPADGPAAGESDPGSMRRGQRIALFARLGAPAVYANPGAFDYARYLRGRGVQAVGTVKSSRLIHAREPGRLSVRVRLMRGADALRGRLLRAIERVFGAGTETRRARAVAGALLVGERGDLEPDDSRALQEAGLTHLLAVSGFNVVVLGGLLLVALRLAGCPRRAATAVALPALWLYLLVNREESSVARAVIMATAWMAGGLVWRRPDLPGALSLSALVLLATRPERLHDPGFQLTFAATASLVAMPRLAALRASPRTKTRRIAAMLAAPCLATLAAMIGTLPLIVAHFNRVTPGALVANLAAGPMMAAAFVALLGMEAVAPLSDGLARAASCLVAHLVAGVFHCAELVGDLPLAHWRRSAPGALVPSIYCAALLAAVALRGRAPAWLTRAAGICACLAGILLALPGDTRRAPEGLRLTTFDVGEGDAILVETPEGGRLLVDAGGYSRSGFDVGERVVSSALWSMGIETIDRLAVTHDDVDHLGGAAAVVRNFHPEEIWLPGGDATGPVSPAMARLMGAAADAGAQVHRLSRASRPGLRGARIEVLSPADAPSPGRTDNERSLVIAVERSGRRALLMGDAGRMTETELVELPLAADLLKVGHHGSRTSSSARFLERVRPAVAAVSCGRRNRFGHPSSDVLARLRAAGARVCRTDRDGAFGVELLGAPLRRTRLDPSCALGGKGLRIPRD